MALAKDQDIPEKPKVAEEPWSFRRLFPMKATAHALAKNFTNPFDTLLAFLILIIGVGQLSNIEISWMTYLLTALILIADVIERHKSLIITEVKKENGKLVLPKRSDRTEI